MTLVLMWEGDVPFAVVADTDPAQSETLAPEPTQSTTQGPEDLRPGLVETDVSPGLPGFLAIFAIAVTTVFLFLGFSKRLRRVTHETGQDNRVTALFDGPAPQRRAPATSASTTAGVPAPADTPAAQDSLTDTSAPAEGSSDSGSHDKP
ncbi:hypothetical protein [Jonesia quinghaiensis]|uniref:hypothetical protein n=1 Tax=Jonesia quinghaiensis TaxID=262806 RepID=UPI00040FBA04|nr:hypothetical protein [Jonesia quinghaiensis]